MFEYIKLKFLIWMANIELARTRAKVHNLKIKNENLRKKLEG